MHDLHGKERVRETAGGCFLGEGGEAGSGAEESICGDGRYVIGDCVAGWEGGHCELEGNHTGEGTVAAMKKNTYV